MNEKVKDHIIIILGVICIFIGIAILSYDYILSKVNNAYDTINLELYGNNVPRNIEEKKVSNNDEIKTTNLDGDSKTSPSNNSIIEKNNKGTEKNNTSYNYVGYVEIPDINLKKGFLNLDSKYNNLKYNVQVISPSDYPDVENGNFILAAHSGNARISFFKNLYKLNEGNNVYVYYNGYKYTYSIVKIYEQYKYDSINIYRDKTKTTLTLVTCTKDNKQNQTIYICELVDKIKT